MIKKLLGIAAILAAPLIYELHGGETKIEPAWVAGAAYEDNKYYLVVEFGLDDIRELIKVDEYTYLNTRSKEVYGFECKYGGISKDILGCKLYEGQ